jgi:hypothetical protein
MAVTLIGEKIAKVGSEFIYCGPLPECKDCRLKNVCFALDEGKMYRITRVRDVKHDCEIHDGCARVVEVERTETPLIVESRIAISGSTFTYSARDNCFNLGCESFRLCFPQHLKGGEKLKIIAVGTDISCPEGNRLTEVKLSRTE